MKIAALALIFGLSLSAQIVSKVSGGGGGGGGGAPTDAEYWLGSSNGSLSAEIVVNDLASLEAAIAAYDFNDAANLTTGNLAAARMQTNVGAAVVTGGSLTSNSIPKSNGSILVDSRLTDNGVWVTVTGGGSTEGAIYLRGNAVGDPSYAFRGDTNTGLGWVSAGQFAVRSGGERMARFGGSQTFLCKNETATTGVTICRVDAGAGQGSTDLFQWRDNAGSTLASVGSTGAALFAALSITKASTPADSTAACTAKEIWSDGSYIYYCVASGTIVRAALAGGF